MELFNFAFFPKYEENIEFLAVQLADPEKWSFSSDTSQSKSGYPILKNYLEYTFRRLRQENKISFTQNNNYACFNTGLVTPNLEDIFAFFERNRDPKPSPYRFKVFLKKSNRDIIQHFANNLPDTANYFENPGLLLYNPRCKIITDIDHIISDNQERFPLHLRNVEEAELRRQLIGSIDEAKKRAQTNYKIAVPQYFRGRIQLLLPLRLTQGSQNPDLALVVDQMVNKTVYSARTCLTIKLAYNNARLIVKPQSDWLKP